MTAMATTPRWRRVLLGCLLAVLAVMLGLVLEGELQARQSGPALAPVPVLADGPPGAPVLILLHGAGMNGHMWDPVRRHLDRRYRVIALDLPGYGARRGQRYTLAAAQAAIQEAARAVAPAKVILVGDSLGGYSAMAAAASIPQEQLRGLVVAGASANFEGGEVLDYLKNLVVVKALNLFSSEEEFLPKALAKLGVEEGDRAAIVAAGGSLSAIPGSVRSLLFVDFRERLAAITQPVLIVNGALDTRSVAQEDSFVAVLQKGSRYRFENCEHGVSIRRSPQFASLVNDFAARAFAP